MDKFIFLLIFFVGLSCQNKQVSQSEHDRRLSTAGHKKNTITELQPQYKPIKPGYAYIFGLISGLLGGAYNTNGPPLIIFGTLRNWSAVSFRATLQGIFLPVNSFIVINHIAGGLWSFELLRILLYTLPVIIPSIFLGGFLHKKISTEKFHRYIYLFLIIIGIVLLVSIFTS